MYAFDNLFIISYYVLLCKGRIYDHDVIQQVCHLYGFKKIVLFSELVYFLFFFLSFCFFNNNAFTDRFSVN